MTMVGGRGWKGVRKSNRRYGAKGVWLVKRCDGTRTSTRVIKCIIEVGMLDWD